MSVLGTQIVGGSVRKIRYLPFVATFERVSQDPRLSEAHGRTLPHQHFERVTSDLGNIPM